MSDQSKYEARKERERARNAESDARGRDIAPLPKVLKPRRKKAAQKSFRKFCESYFPHTFDMAWSADHLTVIGQIEESVIKGGLFATAMPRGSGKTTLAEIACIWSVVYGHRNFIALIGSDEGHAAMMLDSIKTEFESNDLLLEDFPEVAYPVVRLDGIAHRCNGQLFDGERTHIGWTAKEFIAPTIPGSKASGVVIKVAGITGGLRGMKFKRQDGKTVRPSLVVIDDPQTDESARSPSQCRTREEILAGAILGLGGPGKKMSGILPCTVIKPGDMADSILDRVRHPEWNGTRTKMLYSLPSDEKLWEEYAWLRAESLRAGNGGVDATEFYRENREAMDEGAQVAWAARHNPDELSAVQHAMNIKIDRPRAFAAEYQNDPLPEEESRGDDLTADQVMAKVNGMGRGEVPTSCNRLTAFVDVHATVLYYAVCAWADDFTGSVIDYGTFPDQKTPYFTLRDARQVMADHVEASGLEGQIYGGLKALTDALLSKEWPRDDGASMKIDRNLIDGNWQASNESVVLVCRQSAYSAVLMPSRGKYVGASMTPMAEWKRNPGDRRGLNWKVAKPEAKAVRQVVFDSNFWKSFVQSRLAVAMGDRGCLSIFGSKPEEHRLFADHICAEFSVKTVGRGRTCDEWKLRPGNDNHYLDCLVGCAVAASIQGVSLAESSESAGMKKRKVVDFAEAYRQAKGSPSNQSRA